MKKVLIVSPHFPPINAPDMQRVRMALPYLHESGWEPTVLAIEPQSIEGGVREPLLEETYPEDVRVVRVRGLSAALTRWAGVGSLWWRCGRALARAGRQLLRAEKFDLVFFSTTQFDAFTLGPEWKREFGVPFVVDYQDPWVNEYYRRTNARPPGGALRFALSQRRARKAEPRVLRGASAVVAVSDAYLADLAQRYPWFDRSVGHVLPFGIAEKDLEVARRHVPVAPLVDFEDGCFHFVYAGRCGPDMNFSLRALFRGFRLFRSTDARRRADRMRFHFIGTGYAPPPLGIDAVMPAARLEGVEDFVQEHRYRVGYFDTLHYLQRAQALVAIGSDDPAYSASKVFPYLLAQRPLLLLFHRASPVLEFAAQVGAATRIGFDPAEGIDRVADKVQPWFGSGGYEQSPPLDHQAFEPFTARALTAQLTEVFAVAAAT